TAAGAPKAAIEQARISQPGGFLGRLAVVQRACGVGHYVEAVECGAVDPGFMAGEAGRADAGLSRRQGARRCRSATCDVSAAGLCWRSAQSEESAGASRRRR